MNLSVYISSSYSTTRNIIIAYNSASQALTALLIALNCFLLMEMVFHSDALQYLVVMATSAVTMVVMS